jgi:HEAT repeat protein
MTTASLDALGQIVLAGVYPATHEAVLTLAAEKGEAAVRKLRELVLNGNEAVRSDIASALGENQGSLDPERGELLTLLLRDESPLVRSSAIESAGALGAVSLAPMLLEHLRTDPDSVVRACAAEGLGNVGFRGAVPSLIEALKDNSEDVQGYAALSIGLLGSSHDVEALEARLGSASDRVELELLAAMCRLGNRASLDNLKKTSVADEWAAVLFMNVVGDLSKRKTPHFLMEEKDGLTAVLNSIAVRFPITAPNATAIVSALNKLPPS